MSDAGKRGRLAGPAAFPLACYFFSTLLVISAVWFGVACMPGNKGVPAGRYSILGGMVAWDSGWYLSIAEQGYSYPRDKQANVAFFPLYPLVTINLSMLTGLSLQRALVVVAHLCFAAALVILAAYCRKRWPEEPHVWRLTVLACTLFPAGFFFRMGYSESCFLLLALLAFCGFEWGWPLAVTSGVVGLATAARPTGVALLAPLAIYIWQCRSGTRSRLLALALWLPLSCWGLAAYVGYQWAVFGDPLAFAHVQQWWRIRQDVPASHKWIALATLEPLQAVYTPTSPVYWATFDRHWALSWQFATPLFFLGACGLVAIGWHRDWLSRSEAAFSALLLLIPYLTKGYEMGMVSQGRYITVAFPLYIVLGHLFARSSKWVLLPVVATMAFYLAAFAARFAARYFVL